MKGLGRQSNLKRKLKQREEKREETERKSGARVHHGEKPIYVFIA
jgi:hypothetical protein